MRKTKIVILTLWTICATAVFFHGSRFVNSQKMPTPNLGPRRPDVGLIDKFDHAIQARFLTMPNFGMARIVSGMPRKPVKFESGHISYFSPQTEDESSSVRSFVNEGWDVGIYLYGRRAEPKVVNGKSKNEFSIRYRVNEPVPVTTTLKPGDLRQGKHLIDQVKQAFLTYQNTERGAAQSVEFEERDWTYVARPVRAANESCLKCHNDYVITAKPEKKRFTVRRRTVGDVNGILLYAFRKRDHD